MKDKMILFTEGGMETVTIWFYYRKYWI